MKKSMQKTIGIGLLMTGLIFTSQIQAQNQMDRRDSDRMEMRQERMHHGARFHKHRKSVGQHDGIRRGPQARANKQRRMHAKHRKQGKQMHRRMRPMSKQQSLDQAFKSGAISKRQYKKANRRLMKQRVSH